MTSRENERRRFCERARKSRVRDSGLHSLGVRASAATETCVTPTARSAMAPALGKRSHTVGGEGSGKTCVHGRRQGGYYCKECPGKGICEHGRRRSECKECGGGSFCEHGMRRSKCKECGGSGICEHGRQRYFCRECGGGAFCEHGRRKHSCKECRAARDQAAPVLCPPAEPPPAILVEFEDVEDPGEDDDERT